MLRQVSLMRKLALILLIPLLITVSLADQTDNPLYKATKGLCKKGAWFEWSYDLVYESGSTAKEYRYVNITNMDSRYVYYHYKTTGATNYEADEVLDTSQKQNLRGVIANYSWWKHYMVELNGTTHCSSGVCVTVYYYIKSESCERYTCDINFDVVFETRDSNGNLISKTIMHVSDEWVSGILYKRSINKEKITYTGGWKLRIASIKARKLINKLSIVPYAANDNIKRVRARLIKAKEYWKILYMRYWWIIRKLWRLIRRPY